MNDKLLEYLIATGQMKKSFSNKTASTDFNEDYDEEDNFEEYDDIDEDDYSEEYDDFAEDDILEEDAEDGFPEKDF